MTSIRQYLYLLRLPHWSKAVFVFLGLIYSGDISYFPKVLGAALAFCFIASAVYIYNDIQDREADRLHPQKCLRPLANQTVSLKKAIFLLLLLLFLGMSLGWLISKELALFLSLYLLVNIAYNHLLKNHPIYDVLCIASGFMLRVFAGTIGVGLPISCWLTTSATLLSLLIALCKRRLEKNLHPERGTRLVLQKYSTETLDELIILTTMSTFCSYALYTIFARQESFYFLLTLPFAAIGLWRFTWLSKQIKENDDPIVLLFNDYLSRFNFLCFCIITILALVYVT